MSPGSRDGLGRGWRLVAHVAYWTAVVAVSLLFVYGLLMFFESRDASTVDGAGGALLVAELLRTG